jgi:hypothetical protein
MQKAILSGAVIGAVVVIVVMAVIATAQLEILRLALRILWVV